MSKRYTSPGPWSLDRSVNAGPGTVTIFIGPAVDARTHTTYSQGAYKVCVSGPTGKPRTRTFIGETAWYKAEAYATDAVRWLNNWRNESNSPCGESSRGVD